MERKVFSVSELKLDDDGGTFEAVFATLDAIDKDGDSYDPGVIGKQNVAISQWNHGSWGEGAKALPIGVGKIFERQNKAIVQGEFDMEDADAVKTYKKLKYLNSKGHNVEFSFALPDTDYRFEDREGREVRVFTRISVPEVSPVLLGAGVDTELLSIKGSNDMSNPNDKNDDRSPSMRLTDHINQTAEAIEKLSARITGLYKERQEADEKIGVRSSFHIKMLKEVLTESLAQIDEVLNDPSDELSQIAEKLESD